MLSMPSLLRSLFRAFVASCCAGMAPAQETAPELTVIEGRVVDMRGEGVPAAKVWVTTTGDPESVLARGVADGDGFFRIAKVPKLLRLEQRANDTLAPLNRAVRSRRGTARFKLCARKIGRAHV